MEAIQWAIGILVTINLAVTGFLANAIMAHERECKHVNARLASAEGDIERMKQDIGTHSSGLRGNVHDTANQCMQHEMRIAVLEREKR